MVVSERGELMLPDSSKEGERNCSSAIRNAACEISDLLKQYRGLDRDQSGCAL
jgi:hypothetical protein